MYTSEQACVMNVPLTVVFNLANGFLGGEDSAFRVYD